MSKVTLTVSIGLEIHDPEAFAAAARERALADGLEAEEADTYTTDNLSACAVMLLDPGMSPKGSQILESSAEVDMLPDAVNQMRFGMAGGAS